MSPDGPLILGIESTCDETAAAVVDAGGRILSNAVATQHDIHAEFGGVVPELASRAHVRNLIPVLDKALADAGVSRGDLGAIAVANRPGLVGSILTGVAAAKALAWALDLPLLGVDHVHAHLTAASLTRSAVDATPPAADASPVAGGFKRSSAPGEIDRPTTLGLVVSGGHTALYAVDDPLEPERLGGTIDDAAGEAFDKAAVMLGLGHPGGPAIDVLASEPGADPAAIPKTLPRSMLGRDSLDFSFSGLKTALLYAVRGQPLLRAPGERRGAPRFARSEADLTPDERRNLAAAFQHTVVDTLMAKLERARRHLVSGGRAPHRLVIGGGVSANSLLRARAQQWSAENGLTCDIPDLAVCLDNAAMLAGHAHLALSRGRVDDLSLRVFPTTR